MAITWQIELPFHWHSQIRLFWKRNKTMTTIDRKIDAFCFFFQVQKWRWRNQIPGGCRGVDQTWEKHVIRELPRCGAAQPTTRNHNTGRVLQVGLFLFQLNLRIECGMMFSLLRCQEIREILLFLNFFNDTVWPKIVFFNLKYPFQTKSKF